MARPRTRSMSGSEDDEPVPQLPSAKRQIKKLATVKDSSPDTKPKIQKKSVRPLSKKVIPKQVEEVDEGSDLEWVVPNSMSSDDDSISSVESDQVYGGKRSGQGLDEADTGDEEEEAEEEEEVEEDDEEEEKDDDDDDDDDDEQQHQQAQELYNEENEEEDEEVENETNELKSISKNDSSKELAEKELMESREALVKAKRAAKELARYKKFGEELANRGIIYLATVPPFMKPEKVRYMLEQYGEITRIFLVPEDSSIAKRRKKLGGQRSTKYTEGWVEFANKKVAKRVARGLHMTKIGGKKRSFYAEDTWNLKYLKDFTWSHLTEKKAYERRVREHKLRLEMMTAKKQNEEFRQLVDKTKAHKVITERRRKRMSDEDNRQAENESESSSHKKRKDGSMKGLASDDLEKVKRRFHQHKPLTMDGEGPRIHDDILKHALGKSRK